MEDGNFLHQVHFPDGGPESDFDGSLQVPHCDAGKWFPVRVGGGGGGVHRMPKLQKCMSMLRVNTFKAIAETLIMHTPPGLIGCKFSFPSV